MSDISALLSGGPLRSIPQAMLAVMPEDGAAEEIAERARIFAGRYARVALCENYRGGDECPSCACWNEGVHPDMVLAGSWEKAPGIEECLEFQAALSLKPFASLGRLGVVASADTMSLPAANSLLKIVEEPPEGARLLFIAKSEEIVPTLRSRMWILRTEGLDDREVASLPPPRSAAEWASWLERTKKSSLAELRIETRGWVQWFTEGREWRTAASLENLLNLAADRHIPVSMAQDAVYAFLKEGVAIEQIFGNVREA